MPCRWIPVACCLLLAGPAAAAPQAAIESLHWLAGCWADETGEPGTGEVWMAPAGGTLFGAARTVKGGRTVQHEFMQIRASAAGALVFEAMPSGQRPTAFVATAAGEGDITFENAHHDFPQRIAYRRLPDDRLAARIEGTVGGTLRGIDFAFRRTPCEAPPVRRGAP